MTLALLAGCAADDASACAPDFTAGAPAQATTAEVTAIIARSCALGGCHLHAPGAGDLVLDTAADAWTQAVVGVRAHETAMDLVAPGDPDASWLAHKVFGSLCGVTCPGSGCGAPMPFGAALSADERGTISAWIAGGAH